MESIGQAEFARWPRFCQGLARQNSPGDHETETFSETSNHGHRILSKSYEIDFFSVTGRSIVHGRCVSEINRKCNCAA